MLAAHEERNAVDDRRMRSELRRIQEARDETTVEENDEALATQLHTELNGNRRRSTGLNRRGRDMKTDVDKTDGDDK